MQNALHDPESKAFLHIAPLRVAIGTVIMFCGLWLFVILLLYQIARITLLNVWLTHR